MFFEIDDSLSQVDFADRANIHVLEKILDAGIDGNHLINASRRLYKHLLNIAGLSDRYKGYLLNLQGSASYTGVYSQFGVRGIIKNVTSKPIYDQTTGVITLPFRYIKDFKTLLLPTVLLCENLIDCDVLDLAAAHYRLKNGYNGTGVNIDKRLGGGGTTGAVLKRIITEAAQLSICIVDSDRYCPTSAMGSTYKACNAELKAGVWNARLYSTSGRELENDIPFKILQNSLAEVDDLNANIQKLFENKSSVRLWKYLDLKDGVHSEWVFKLNNPSSDFWIVDDLIKHDECNPDCVGPKACKKKSVDCHNGVIFNGIGKTILDHVSAWGEKNSGQKSLESATGDNSDDWFTLGRHVFYHCVASKKYRF
ncbi:hypothetical protein [Methylophilus sp. UBA6697]|jgi:hypothetical protein|uniref:hypothetical protein n=1 Tax=Methylophilus sp. UBA6697 TaxID=1946902 RepID=UPI000EE96B5A|nr:hypothetical protein [Methylophilus sp. UBA6697]HCU85820.1 hypothetical protein [Methylophilus sp.]